MASSIAAIISKTDRVIGDTTTNSVTQADRFAAIRLACQELITDFGFEQSQTTYDLNFYDSIEKYKLTSDIPNFLEPTDVRTKKAKDNNTPFTRKDPRELAVEYANDDSEISFAIERQDTNTYMFVNKLSKYPLVDLHDCDTLANNGTWTADTSASDATNVELDEVEFNEGVGSISFDADVSQSANNRATIYNEDMSSVDLSDYNNISSIIFDIYLPATTNFSSVTAYWGSSSTAYWSGTATTDFNSNAFVAGWNTLKIDWSSASMTSTPDDTAIDYLRFDYNYAAGYSDTVGLRLDNVRIVRPEVLTLFYQGAHVGKTTGGTKLYAFTATDDVPFYSGQYDYFDNAVSFRAAEALYVQMGQDNRAEKAHLDYEREVQRLQKRFPSNGMKPTRSFKVHGINFRRTTRRRRLI